MLDTTTAEEALRARMEADAKRMIPFERQYLGEVPETDDLPKASAEVLSVLSDDPKTATEIAHELGYENGKSVSNAIRVLKSRGLILEAGVTRRGGGPVSQWVRAVE